MEMKIKKRDELRQCEMCPNKFLIKKKNKIRDKVNLDLKRIKEE